MVSIEHLSLVNTNDTETQDEELASDSDVRIVLSYKTPRKDVLDVHALELFFLIPSQLILYGHLLHKQTNPV